MDEKLKNLYSENAELSLENDRLKTKIAELLCEETPERKIIQILLKENLNLLEALQDLLTVEKSVDEGLKNSSDSRAVVTEQSFFDRFLLFDNFFKFND